MINKRQLIFDNKIDTIRCTFKIKCQSMRPLSDNILENYFFNKFELDVVESTEINNGTIIPIVISKDNKVIERPVPFNKKVSPIFNYQINGYRKVIYRSNTKTKIRPLPIVCFGLYCRTCGQVGPNRHLEECNNQTLQNLYFTVAGLQRYPVINLNSKGYYSTFDPLAKVYEINNNFINPNNTQLTNINITDYKKYMKDSEYISQFTIVYNMNGINTLIYIYPHDDQITNISIQSNTWNITDDNIIYTILPKINSTLMNIYENTNIQEEEYLLVAQATTLSSIFINIRLTDNYILNVIDFLGYFNGMLFNGAEGAFGAALHEGLTINNQFVRYHGNLYKVSMERSGHRTIIRFQSYFDTNTIGMYLFSIQVFEQAIQIYFSYTQETLELKEIFDLSIKSIIEYNFQTIYDIFRILINSILVYQHKNGIPKILTPKPIDSKNSLENVTRLGFNVPYEIHDFYTKTGKITKKTQETEYVSYYDLVNKEWYPEAFQLIINNVNNSFDIKPDGGNDDDIIRNVPHYLLKHNSGINRSGNIDRGTSVCRDTMSSNEQTFPGSVMSLRPKEYSFYGRCQGGELFSTFYDKKNNSCSLCGNRAREDNLFYPCCSDISMSDYINYLNSVVQFVLYGQTQRTINNCLMPLSMTEYDYFSGIFRSNYIYIGSSISILREDGEEIQVVVLGNPIKQGAAQDITHTIVVAPVDENGNVLDDQKMEINLNQIHPKYIENRRFDGIYNILDRLSNGSSTGPFIINENDTLVERNNKMNALNEKYAGVAMELIRKTEIECKLKPIELKFPLVNPYTSVLKDYLIDLYKTYFPKLDYVLFNHNCGILSLLSINVYTFCMVPDNSVCCILCLLDNNLIIFDEHSRFYVKKLQKKYPEIILKGYITSIENITILLESADKIITSNIGFFYITRVVKDSRNDVRNDLRNDVKSLVSDLNNSPDFNNFFVYNVFPLHEEKSQIAEYDFLGTTTAYKELERKNGIFTCIKNSIVDKNINIVFLNVTNSNLKDLFWKKVSKRTTFKLNPTFTIADNQDHIDFIVYQVQRHDNGSIIKDENGGPVLITENGNKIIDNNRPFFDLGENTKNAMNLFLYKTNIGGIRLNRTNIIPTFNMKKSPQIRDEITNFINKFRTTKYVSVLLDTTNKQVLHALFPEPASEFDYLGDKNTFFKVLTLTHEITIEDFINNNWKNSCFGYEIIEQGLNEPIKLIKFDVPVDVIC